MRTKIITTIIIASLALCGCSSTEESTHVINVTNVDHIQEISNVDSVNIEEFLIEAIPFLYNPHDNEIDEIGKDLSQEEMLKEYKNIIGTDLMSKYFFNYENLTTIEKNSLYDSVLNFRISSIIPVEAVSYNIDMAQSSFTDERIIIPGKSVKLILDNSRITDNIIPLDNIEEQTLDIDIVLMKSGAQWKIHPESIIRPKNQLHLSY